MKQKQTTDLDKIFNRVKAFYLGAGRLCRHRLHNTRQEQKFRQCLENCRFGFGRHCLRNQGWHFCWLPSLLEIKNKSNTPIHFKIRIEMGDGKTKPSDEVTKEANNKSIKTYSWNRILAGRWKTPICFVALILRYCDVPRSTPHSSWFRAPWIRMFLTSLKENYFFNNLLNKK